MFDCIQKIRNAQESGALKRNPKKFRRQMVTILNFLDAIAIGIEQELYVEDLAYDHLEAIVKSFVRDLIDSGLIVKAGYPIEHWRRLIALRDRWQQGRPIPS